MNKRFSTIIVLLLFNCFLFGQSSQVLYNAEIQSASVDLQDEQYRSAIKHADKARTYLGQDSTTTQIEYIITKSYVGLGYFDDAKTSLKRYFDISKEGDFGYNEMLLLLSKIDDMEEENRRAEENQKILAKQEIEAWENTIKINTIEAYRNFAVKFPQSIYTKEANKKLDDYNRSKTALSAEKLKLKEYESNWKAHRFSRSFLWGMGFPVSIAGLVVLDTDAAAPLILVGNTFFLSGLLFAHPIKHKKRYKKQLNVVTNLEKGLLSDSYKNSPFWQIGMSTQSAGLTLSYNF